MANHAERYELLQRITQLSPEDQMVLVEGVLANLRRAHFTDHEANARALDEMIADPGFQRMLNNQDLPFPEAEASREAGAIY